MSLRSVNSRVQRSQSALERIVPEARLDTSVADRIGHRRGCQLIDIEARRNPSHLEREVRVASADDREIPFAGDRLHPLPVLGVFPVDFDRVEGGVALAEDRTW